MKTTIDIADSLLDEARAVAAKRGVTLKALVERGLRREIEEAASRPAFKLRDASFGGDGLQPDAERSGWDAIRALSYEAHGG